MSQKDWDSLHKLLEKANRIGTDYSFGVAHTLGGILSFTRYEDVVTHIDRHLEAEVMNGVHGLDTKSTLGGI